MNSIEINGLEDFEELLQDLTIDEKDEKRAMNKAIDVIKAEVEKNTPYDTGIMRRSIKKNVKSVTGEGTVGTVKINSFAAVFQEFGTSQQRQHVGFFERSVNTTQEQAIETLTKELLG